jgi:hypothetical protein
LAPSQGGTSNQDPRVNDFLRWSAALSTPVVLGAAAMLIGLLVSLRDATRDLNTKVTLIAESDRRQNVQIEKYNEAEQVQNREIDRLKDRVLQLQTRTGLR